jgi:NitT/TauT family transport system substrate-binding protein
VAFCLSVGYLSTLYHTSHLLRHLGWVERELGVPCRWHLFGAGPEMLQAFARGEILLGYIGLPPAMIGISRGIPLVCVAGGHVEGTVMVAGPEHRALEEAGSLRSCLEPFCGKRVGVPAAGSIHDVIFRSLLRTHAVSPVEVVNFRWADLIPYAFRKGELSAVVGTPPLAVLCEQECGTRIVIPPEALWPFNPSYGIVIRQERLCERGLLKGFLSLHERACNRIRESPESAARETVRALPGLDESFVRKVYAVSPRYCASLPEAYVLASLDFFPTLQELGYVETAVSRETVFHEDLIREVHPEPPHY